MNVPNYGFSGLAVTLPKVWQEFDKEVSDELISDSEHAQSMGEALLDLTEGIHKLGKILSQDREHEQRIYNRATNNEMYYDYSSTRAFVKDKIELLMNNVLIIGEMALSLLETMWGHLKRLNMEEPDEFAYRAVRGCYNGVMENAID